MATSGFVRVKFFASIREFTGLAEDRLLITEACTVADVRTTLAARGPIWDKCLGSSAVVRAAVNQDIVQDDHIVIPGDELAFFPPVTGG
jgi:molybdopterin synthase sulfur carrier subunit